MKLSPEQERLAEAYDALGPVVLDDILLFAATYDERGQKPTGMDVYAHIQKRVTLRRRAARKTEPKPAKRLEIRNAS